MIEVERQPGHSEEDDHQDQHLDSPSSRGQSPEMLLVSGDPHCPRAPEMIGDERVGEHGDQERHQELDQEHDQRDPGPGGGGQDQLTPVQGLAGEDWQH